VSGWVSQPDARLAGMGQSFLWANLSIFLNNKKALITGITEQDGVYARLGFVNIQS
jgi:hypothetical protein